MTDAQSEKIFLAASELGWDVDALAGWTEGWVVKIGSESFENYAEARRFLEKYEAPRG